MTAINRRRALIGSAVATVGVPVLAACSDDSGTTASDPAGSSAPDDESSSPSDDGDTGGDTGGGESIATVSDVPVGGCFVVGASKVVLTQPTEGDIRAFSAVCTHQGCAVESSTDGEIPCPCHGSTFSIEDGSVVNGPATTGLDEVQITVDGDAVSLA